MRRRRFLKTVSAAPLAWVEPGLADGHGSFAISSAPTERATLSAEQWLSLEVIQDHLLPSEPDNPGAPGAREVNATAYLDRAMAVPGFDAQQRALILDGVGWLDELSRVRVGMPFRSAAPASREDLLHEVAATPAGERWLSSLIGFTLEALLADPLYGGNPRGIGWNWLDHDPGQPRPTPDNLFGKLGRG